MKTANKHETFMRQIGVLSEMVGTELTLDSNGETGYRITTKGSPMFAAEYVQKSVLEKMVLFAISSLRMK